MSIADQTKKHQHRGEDASAKKSNLPNEVTKNVNNVKISKYINKSLNKNIQKQQYKNIQHTQTASQPQLTKPSTPISSQTVTSKQQQVPFKNAQYNIKNSIKGNFVRRTRIFVPTVKDKVRFELIATAQIKRSETYQACTLNCNIN